MATRGKVFAFNLWLFDLTLTACSFLAAYRLRSAMQLSGHQVFPIEIYLWMLAPMLAIWAIALPANRTYREPLAKPGQQCIRLARGLVLAWIVFGAVLFASERPSNRVLVALTLVINAVLLAGCRLVIFRQDPRTPPPTATD